MPVHGRPGESTQPVHPQSIGGSFVLQQELHHLGFIQLIEVGRQIYTAMCLSKSVSSLIIILVLVLYCSTIKSTTKGFKGQKHNCLKARVCPPWCVRPLTPTQEQSCHGCRWLPPWHQNYHTCCLIIVPCILGEKTLDYVKVALG